MELLTGREVMAFLKVSRASLYRLLEAGLPSLGRGRLRRFDREEVLAWYATLGDDADVPPAVEYRCDGCGIVIEADEGLQACPKCGSGVREVA